MNKDDMKRCKYRMCRHGGTINTMTDKYKVEGKSYYHEDCFREKKDLMLFRQIWHDNISANVVYSQLNSVLNRALSGGLSSAYILFVLQYVIDHKMNLRHPPGIMYYVDNENIKTAYQKEKANKMPSPDVAANKAVQTKAEQPVFKVSNRPVGFGSIMKHE